MTQAYNPTAPKKATNLSINSDLLSKARDLKLNLSATLERTLADEVQKATRDQWLKKNKRAIDASNKLAGKNGLFSDSHRTI
ncbi:MAG: type II toxin-antitoxin system CcdA family antitoxin [Pseudomonadota bacterium]|nr:type II toxin-antitoxin system CcdA family antitoxin [Pseudomonadota bacterium]